MWKSLVAAALVVVIGVGLYLFQPWRLFTNSTVDEAAPMSTPSSIAPPSSPSPSPSPTTEVPPQDRILARGDFEDAEHATTGRATILRLADGRRYVRLEDLDTSDGPDLHVWLSDQPSGGDWASYDDGRSVALGGLKANRGNQNYPIPESAEIAGMTSVVIWCDRFNVAFGTAPIALSG